MFDNQDFFQEEIGNGPGPVGNVAGSIGSWGLHAAKVAFLIYSGYHGISAAIGYAGSSELAVFAQIVGIVVLEVTLLSLYLAWHNQRITGPAQMVVAALTYAIGFILACLGIVADSQLHAGSFLSPWLAGYLRWGLPVAPAVMALGALLTHELAPLQLRARIQSTENLNVENERFRAFIAGQRAELQAQKSIANANLNARANAARQIASYYQSDEVQSAIRQSALASFRHFYGLPAWIPPLLAMRMVTAV